jgi:hypothetical protein
LLHPGLLICFCKNDYAKQKYFLHFCNTLATVGFAWMYKGYFLYSREPFFNGAGIPKNGLGKKREI